jgi:uncharacterized protein
MEVSIQGTAGRLAGVLWQPEGTPRASVVLCHPHPTRGGTMDSSVVFRAGRALQGAGLAVLRFDFRGVRASEGHHDGDEWQDLDVALAWLAGRYPRLPQWAAGFSFGARTVCELLAREPDRVERVLLIALPLLAYPCEAVGELRVPGLVLMAGEDEFGTSVALEARFPHLAGHLTIDEVPGADHFFTGALEDLQQRVETWAQEALSKNQAPR